MTDNLFEDDVDDLFVNDALTEIENGTGDNKKLDPIVVEPFKVINPNLAEDMPGIQQTEQPAETPPDAGIASKSLEVAVIPTNNQMLKQKFEGNGVEIQPTTFDFLHEKLKTLIPQRTIRRLSSRGERWYFYMEMGQPKWNLGVTNWISRYIKPTKELLDWQLKNFNSVDEMMVELNHRAHYGTWFHKHAGAYLQIRPINTADKELKNLIQEHWEFEKIDPAGENLNKWMNDTKQDMVGIRYWAEDYKVVPLAIELSLVSDLLGLGGSPDLVAQMTVPVKKNGRKVKGEFEDIVGMTDWKSRRTGFFPSDLIQLIIYMLIWNETFPDLELTRAFSYHCHKFNFPMGSSVIPYKMMEQDINSPDVRPIIDGLLEGYRKISSKTKTPKFKTTIKGENLLRDPEIEGYDPLKVEYESFDIDAYIAKYDGILLPDPEEKPVKVKA